MANTANELKDGMWDFLKDGNQQCNLSMMEKSVHTLIRMATQKSGGQDKYGRKDDVSFDLLDMVAWSIICEAAAMVLDPRYAEVKKLFDGGKAE